MSMTRKHFQAVADACVRADEQLSFDGINMKVREHVMRRYVEHLSREFKRQNPAFDAERFRKACGLDYV